MGLKCCSIGFHPLTGKRIELIVFSAIVLYPLRGSTYSPNGELIGSKFCSIGFHPLTGKHSINEFIDFLVNELNLYNMYPIST